jgi:hypothetical protein
MKNYGLLKNCFSDFRKAGRRVPRVYAAVSSTERGFTSDTNETPNATA